MQRLYVGTDQPDSQRTHVSKIQNSQRFFILRTWSAKQFEMIEFMERKKYNKTKDAVLSGLCNAAKQKFENRGLADTFGLVRDLRNEVSNHISLSAARKNLAYLADNSDFSFLLHEAEGNSFYGLGDEVVFGGRLNRSFAQNSFEENKLLFKQWLDWNLAANEWLREVLNDFAQKIVFERFPDRKWTEEKIWVEDRLVGDLEQSFVPFILRKK